MVIHNQSFYYHLVKIISWSCNIFLKCYLELREILNSCQNFGPLDYLAKSSITFERMRTNPPMHSCKKSRLFGLVSSRVSSSREQHDFKKFSHNLKNFTFRFVGVKTKTKFALRTATLFLDSKLEFIMNNNLLSSLWKEGIWVQIFFMAKIIRPYLKFDMI